MKSEVVLKVKNLSKDFKIYPTSSGRIKEWLTFGKLKYHKKFQALINISFEVRRGGFLGIIGPNGAGKSTLLKIITGALEPTSGSYKISGKVLSLLELSGGLDADLTGRENIIRTAQLLGFPTGIILGKMEKIAEFADLGEFFDRPLSIYSSGMRIRLAFSMFAFLDCDVLILDEVLAVGDIFFRQKCYARLEELIKQNVAIVLVTHSMGAVRRYCNEVIVLENGRIAYQGTSDAAIQKYFEIKKDQGITIKVSDTHMEEDYIPAGHNFAPRATDQLTNWPPDSVFDKMTLPEKNENKYAKLTHLMVCDMHGNPRQVFKQGETAYFYFAYLAKEKLGIPIAGITILTMTNLVIHGKNSLQHNADHPLKVTVGDTVRYNQSVKLDIAPGSYIFSLNFFTMHPLDYNQMKFSSKIEFDQKKVKIIQIKSAGFIEVISRSPDRPVDLHGGLCNLDGEMQIDVINSR